MILIVSTAAGDAALVARVEGVLGQFGLTCRKGGADEALPTEATAVLAVVGESSSAGLLHGVCGQALGAGKKLVLILPPGSANPPWLALLPAGANTLVLAEGDDQPLKDLAAQLGGRAAETAATPDIFTTLQGKAVQSPDAPAEDPPKPPKRSHWKLVFGAGAAVAVGWFVLKPANPCEEAKALGYQCDAASLAKGIREEKAKAVQLLAAGKVKLEDPQAFDLFITTKYSPDAAKALLAEKSVVSDKACVHLLQSGGPALLEKFQGDAARKSFVRDACGTGEFPSLLEKETKRAEEAAGREKQERRNPTAACVATLRKEFPPAEMNSLRGSGDFEVQNYVTSKIGNRMTVPAEFRLVPDMAAMMRRGMGYEQAAQGVCQRQGASRRDEGAAVRKEYLAKLQALFR